MQNPKFSGVCKALSICACLLCSACATPVQPWEKGALAKTDMGFGVDRMEGRFNAHIYSSKEAASGGASVGGGGCGCN